MFHQNPDRPSFHVPSKPSWLLHFCRSIELFFCRQSSWIKILRRFVCYLNGVLLSKSETDFETLISPLLSWLQTRKEHSDDGVWLKIVPSELKRNWFTIIEYDIGKDSKEKVRHLLECSWLMSDTAQSTSFNETKVTRIIQALIQRKR